MDGSTIERALELARTDGEIAVHAARESRTFAFVIGTDAWRFTIDAGKITGPTACDVVTVAHNRDVTVVTGSAEAWSTMTAAVPPPGYIDIFGVVMAGAMTIAPEAEIPGRHHLLRRMSELLRHAENGTDPTPQPLPNRSRHGQHDQAVGRYVHLDLGDVDNRIYYEEAGSGIGLICQHTAGADARQWRHLLEDSRVTDHFRVIAYDLPRHARSLPPESEAWWAQEYNLTTEAAMEVPVKLARVLGLDRPVFIGSSVGGMLALDLARYHADDFRASIALEGALRSSADLTPESAERNLQRRARRRMIDPAFHGATMMSLMALSSPEAYRHETVLHYDQGAPGVHIGDTYYFTLDHDLRDEAHLIDTDRCAVYLLSGEYDYNTVEMTKLAGAAIAGAKTTIMEGLGHFPMSENHDQLMTYVLPILDEIRAASA